MDTSRPQKKARRSSIRPSDDLHNFFSFPEIQPQQQQPPFRDNVRLFLSAYARVTFPPSSLFSSLVTWQILLRLGDLTAGGSHNRSPVTVSLDVVEEDVTKSSRPVYCDHCRVVGWSGHPVCRKRYHFIIRLSDSNSLNGSHKHCSRCGNTGKVAESSCKWCNSEIAVNNVEEWVYSQLEDHNHLLHAVVHSNGYGHLLNVNGKEGGSNYLSGHNIMDFWDRLCTRLSIRMVSVMDVSRKYGMEYRLLHAVTKECSWYGNWGYEFRSGSYALTQDAYMNAVKTLSSMPLNSFLFQGRKSRTRLHNTIGFYQSLSDSELLTTKDLFSFLLSLILEGHRNRVSKTSKEAHLTSSNVLCVWTRSDVEHIQQAIIKVLVAAKGQSNWVTRRALKGAMFRATSPELLEYSLKHLQGVLTDDSKVVCSRYNPNINDFEYRLDPLSSAHRGSGSNADYPSEEHMTRDLRYLFDSLLHPQSVVNQICQATRDRLMDAGTKILDCKHFIKDYKPKNYHSLMINLWCHLELFDKSKDNPTPPAELVVLPINATVADLKKEAAKAFQEVYAMFKRLEVDQLLEYGSVDESITLKFLIGTTASVRIRGSSKYGLLRYRMERGTENWEVDCICGTKDDDGERMSVCDACGIWHHTRCAGIKDSDDLPSKFLCVRCNSSKIKTAIQFDSKGHQVSKAALSCRGETASVDGNGVKSTLSATLTVR